MPQSLTNNCSQGTQGRSQELLRAHQQEIYVQTDKLFAWLMICQWVACIGIALWVSPRAWAGRYSDTHIHVWTALILGGLIAVLPVYLGFERQGKPSTRHVIAIGQSLFSVLLIHLTGGKIESHFHVFGSLAFLSFYRDWPVLISASVVVAIDHIFRGFYFPESVYGISAVEPLRAAEHIWWVIFEDVFLVRACLLNVKEMTVLAKRQAEIEETKEVIEVVVVERTKELKESTVLTNRILETVSDAFIAVDEQGVLTDWNRKAEEIFGWTRQETLGRKIEEVLVAVDGRTDPFCLRTWLSMEQSSFRNDRFELDALSKTGRSIPLECTTFSVQAGAAFRICAFIRDITERRETERRVNEFYSIVSHELRSPLTAIKGSLGLMESGIVELGTEESQELVVVARNSADRLIRLITDMLDLKKIESGNMPLHLSKLSVDKLVEETVLSITGMCEDFGVTIRRDVVTDVFVEGDSDKCVQILTNLVSNAVKFSPKGSEVIIRTAIGEAGRVRFSVIDTGSGISKADLQKLFKKFQQLDSSDTRAHGGTGLGLAICKALVEEHQGVIGCDSTVGQGTTFWFELSLWVDKATNRREAFLPGSALSVLLVEDDLALSTVLCAYLRTIGYQPIGVGTLAEARQCLVQARPHVVILDIVLPDGNGLEFIETLKSSSDTEHIPVIVLTGEQRPTGLVGSASIVDWLRKPLEIEKLERSLNRAFSALGYCKMLVMSELQDNGESIICRLQSLGLSLRQSSILAAEPSEPLSGGLTVLEISQSQLPAQSDGEPTKSVEFPTPPLIIFSKKDLDQCDRTLLNSGLETHLSKGNQPEQELHRVLGDILLDLSHNDSILLDGGSELRDTPPE